MLTFTRPSSVFADLRFPQAPSRVYELLAGETHSLQEVFAGLSSASRQARYLGPTPRLRSSMVRGLTDLKPGRHHAFVALHEGRAVGIARWIRLRERPWVAEVALEVVDEHHGRGIGSQLMTTVTASVQRHGITVVEAHVGPDNAVVRGWASSLGARQDRDDPELLRLPLGRGEAGSVALTR